MHRFNRKIYQNTRFRSGSARTRY